MFVKRFAAWLLRLKPYRVYQAYSRAGGNLSAAGMSFQALFAVFAGVWVVFAIFGLFISGDSRVRAAIIAYINIQIPGLIGPHGLINPDALYSVTTLSVSGVIALVIMAWTAVNWIDYARVAIHHMFGLPPQQTGYVYLKVADFIIAVGYGLFVLVGALLSVFATSLFVTVVTSVGLADTLGSVLDVLIRGLSIVVVLALDTIMLGTLIRLLAGATIPWRFLWRGALLGGVAMGAMKLAGAALLSGATRNPLLASVAVFVGLLIWFNLTSRVTLLTAQWMATGMRDAGIDPRDVGWVVTRDSIAKPFRRKK
jgi:membrane protein